MSEETQKIFGLNIRLDSSELENLVFRVGHSFDNLPSHPQDALHFFSKYETLDQQGDGIKSFVANWLTLKIGARPILLIDEPEAFLHAPQARKMGEIIAKNATDDRQIFISTHSSALLTGLIENSKDISIVRIDRNGNENTFSILEAEDILSLTKNPLLSSTRVLEGLFHRGSVLVEGDADCTFYPRISRQVSESDDLHYLPTYNKQNHRKVLEPFRKFGIKCAAIADIDVINDNKEFKQFISSMIGSSEQIDEMLSLRNLIASEIESKSNRLLLCELRDKLIEFFGQLNENCTLEESKNKQQLDNARRLLGKIRDEASPWDILKEKGSSILSHEGQQSFAKLSEIAKTNGLFIVPEGQLECWLKDYDLPTQRDKAKWIAKALEKLPSLPLDRNKGIWAFIKEIQEYLQK